MENASKALIMAGGVLIAIIIVSVIVLAFQRSGNVSADYSKSISREEISTFNANFTKYLDHEFTIHQVVTIYNFDKNNNTKQVDCDTTYNATNIIEELKQEKTSNQETIYEIKIISYDSEGFVKKISFNSTKRTIT